MSERAAIIEEEADWLVDAVGVAIYSNSKKAIETAITRALGANTTAQVKVLEALREYGAHKTTCNAYRSHATGEIRGGYRDLKDPRSYNEECTCGLAASLAVVPPAPPSSDEMASLRAGLEGVTPGPWHVWKNPDLEDDYYVVRRNPDGTPIRHTAAHVYHLKKPDAEHIARCSPEAILSLLARLDAANASPPPSIPEREKQLADALRGMLAEWDKLTRYGSPLAKAANENVNRAKVAIAALEGK